MDLGHREALRAERGKNAIFAVDCMGSRKQFPRRFSAQDVGAASGIDPIGRVGLPALELADADGAFEAVNIGRHPAVQRLFIEAKPIADRPGAAVRFGAIHFVHIYR